MNYLKRLVWRTEEERFNSLMHIFFFMSLVFGVAFAIAPQFFGADLTILYTQTLIGNTGSSAWGWAMIVVTLVNTYVLATRSRFLGSACAAVGFMLWLYAFITYLLAAYWLGLLAAAVPNMLFWTWYYFKVKAYHRNPPENY